MNRWRRLRSAIETKAAQQQELNEAERRERDRVSSLVGVQADELQRRLGERFPRLPLGFVGLVTEVAARPRIDDIGTHAGALTYGAFLALPPLLLFASSVLGFVLAGHPAMVQNALNTLVDLVPGLQAVVTSQLQGAIDGRVTLGIIGLIGLLWSASGFASRLRHALGVIFRTTWSGLLTGRFRGMIIGFLMVAAFVGLAAFTWIQTWAQGAERSTAARLLQTGGFALGGFVLFLVTYRLLTPGKGVTLRDHLPGAVVFTVAWVALTAIGGFVFASVIQKSTALYGTIGAIFGLLAFLYATMWSLLIGAELSAVLMARRDRATRTEPDR